MMPQTLRSSGIPFLDDVPWGSHLGVFYETHDDLIDAAARFFEQGLDNNELCIWAPPDHVAAADAAARLRAQIADLDTHITAGRMRFIAANKWHGSETDPGFWSGVFDEAFVGGHDGVRASGDAVWLTAGRHGDALHYEEQIARRLAGRPALALSTYDVTASRGPDVLDIARLHGLAVARRRGEWQPFETPSWRATADLEAALAAMTSAIRGSDHLTERERMVLGLLVRGASSKEVARDLGISPRTADFHRANIIEKLGARNTADVIRRVLSRR
jgi:DNA-binding CsgD family transcriptional regulator